MKNNQKDLNHFTNWVKKLLSDPDNSGVAEQAADYINGVFVIIPRDDLPEITFGTLDDAIAGDGFARTNNLTEEVFNGDFKKMRKLGLQYLAMADYVEDKVAKEQISSAKTRRFKVFKDLFPENIATFEEFDWSGLHDFEQMVIDKMVLLKMEVDKDF